MSDLPWLAKLPEIAYEVMNVTAMKQHSKSGPLGFRTWTIGMTGKIESECYYDPGQRVWWTYIEIKGEKVLICWQGQQPPEEHDIYRKFEWLMTRERHDKTVSNIVFSLYDDYGIQGVIELYKIAPTALEVKKIYEKYGKNIRQLADFLGLESKRSIEKILSGPQPYTV